MLEIISVLFYVSDSLFEIKKYMNGNKLSNISETEYSEHIRFMELAIEQAELAGKKEEVPVGAVLVSESGKIISKAHNLTIALCDPTAHAEILLIKKAATVLQNYRLIDTRLYVTIEPCMMCMAAAVHARIKLIVFGASDPKWGAAGSIYEFHNDMRLNHRPEIIKGVMEKNCEGIIKKFFEKKRKNCPELNKKKGV